MNVTCTGCPAKYAVPDEKVRGKKVRITCKHCGTNLVVDGTALGAGQSVLPGGPQPATASVHQISSLAPQEPAAARELLATAKPAFLAAAAPESTFVVGFVDDHQESHTVSQIVDMYSGGMIDDEALVWKDGMPDWLSPFEVPEIASACLKRGVTRRALAPVAGAPIAPADEEATLVGRSPFEDDDVPGPLPAQPAPADFSPLPEPRAKAPSLPGIAQLKPFSAAIAAAPRSAAPAPAVAAARRVENRAGAVDLFGGVAEAGSEADASLDFGTADEPAHKMTGARNESSVLFSLDALTKPDPKANQKQKARDKEQEQASEALFGDSAPNSLLNLGGGGGLAALAAPDFSRPITPVAEPVVHAAPAFNPSDNDAPKRKGGGAVLLVGSLLGIAAVAGGAFIMMKRQPVEPQLPVAASPASATAATAATPAAAQPSTTDAPTASTNREASATEAGSANAVVSAEAAPVTPVAAGTKSTAAAPVTNTPAVADKPVEPATPTPPAEGAAFDKGAAVAALGAAAASASSCKKPDGPTGTGKASVTFAASGRATATNVSGSFAGTDVGGCVARLFRAAKVPAFSGDPVTVSKSFSIE